MSSFVWSWSSLAQFYTCPRQFAEVTYYKRFARSSSPALDRGRDVHDELAAWAVDPTRKPRIRIPSDIERFVDVLGEEYGPPRVERRLGVTADWRACDFFAPDVAGRGVVDALWYDHTSGVIVDWKTGGSIADDGQLELMGLMVLAHMPELETVASYFCYVDQNANPISEPVEVTKDDLERVRAEGWPKLVAFQRTFATYEAEKSWPPEPGRHCAWCPVSTCIFYRGDGVR